MGGVFLTAKDAKGAKFAKEGRAAITFFNGLLFFVPLAPFAFFAVKKEATINTTRHDGVHPSHE